MSVIIYEDNHILVANKQAGIPTQPSPEGGASLEDELKALIKIRDQKPRGVFLHAIHRIDKPVSGAVIFAKSQKALERLNAAQREGKIQKWYYALIDSNEIVLGEYIHFLRKAEHKALISSSNDLDAKKAVLHILEKKQLKKYTVVFVQLDTGRYHQIRSQLAAIGFPIVGDEKYGSIHRFHPGAIALHSAKLSFIHPVSGVLLELNAPCGFVDVSYS